MDFPSFDGMDDRHGGRSLDRLGMRGWRARMGRGQVGSTSRCSPPRVSHPAFDQADRAKISGRGHGESRKSMWHPEESSTRDLPPVSGWIGPESQRIGLIASHSRPLELGGALGSNPSTESGHAVGREGWAVEACQETRSVHVFLSPWDCATMNMDWFQGAGIIVSGCYNYTALQANGSHSPHPQGG